MALSPLQIKALHYVPRLNLVYVNNQKSACTSIKYSLWTADDGKTGRKTYKGKTHDRKSSPFLSVEDILSNTAGVNLDKAAVFSVVRNPFSRILSAYLHHIYDGTSWVRFTRKFGLWRSTAVRDAFYRAARIGRSHSLTFEAFLLALKDVDAHAVSGHFRPQSFNLSYDTLSYDFICHMETSSELSAFLRGNGIEYRRRSGHSQQARDHLQDFYTDRAAQLVRELFATDFEMFGYSKEDLEAPPGIIAKSGETFLADFVALPAGYAHMPDATTR